METTVTPGERIKTDSVVQDHVTLMKLEILQVTPADFTSYKCVARNSLGETDGRIKVYGIDLVVISSSSFLSDTALTDPAEQEEETSTVTTTTERRTSPRSSAGRRSRPTRRHKRPGEERGDLLGDNVERYFQRRRFQTTDTETPWEYSPLELTSLEVCRVCWWRSVL